jgi:hypothetical protein
MRGRRETIIFTDVLPQAAEPITRAELLSPFDTVASINADILLYAYLLFVI